MRRLRSASARFAGSKLIRIGHHVATETTCIKARSIPCVQPATSATTRSASFTRTPPEISLGSSVSRSIERVRLSETLFQTRWSAGAIRLQKSFAIGNGGMTTRRLLMSSEDKFGKTDPVVFERSSGKPSSTRRFTSACSERMARMAQTPPPKQYSSSENAWRPVVDPRTHRIKNAYPVDTQAYHW
jgi:hypothetical protein